MKRPVSDEAGFRVQSQLADRMVQLPPQFGGD